MLAGYSLLFAAHEAFWGSERFESHEYLVDSIAKGLQDGQLTLPLPPGLGVQAKFSSSEHSSPPRMRTSQDGTLWFVSRTKFQLSGNQPVVLEVRQKISESAQHIQKPLLILIVAGGGSVLFTAMLLRLVLWRGISLPLQKLTAEIQKMQADSLGNHMLNPEEQPSEYISIVESFNDLQARLAQSWQRERSFIDGVAHELRTPITVISGHAQRLQEDELKPSQTSIEVIAAEAKRLGDLTSVMLDFARIDAGRLSLFSVELDPEAVLLEAFERLQCMAPHRLQLAPSVSGHLPSIWADPERVHQCLAALVENALSYSDGFVELRVSSTPSAVTLHVRDQGPGIPIWERAQVLERFVRGSSASGTQGSGIGLSIVHALMRMMQGELLIGEAPEGGADLQLRFKFSARPPAP